MTGTEIMHSLEPHPPHDPTVTWTIGEPGNGGRIGRGIPTLDVALSIARDHYGDALELLTPERDEPGAWQVKIDGQLIRFVVFKVRGIYGAGAIMPELRCRACRRTL